MKRKQNKNHDAAEKTKRERSLTLTPEQLQFVLDNQTDEPAQRDTDEWPPASDDEDTSHWVSKPD